jgi:hypothetical protein
MSTEKRVTFDAEGQPVVTLTISGWHDVFRFAWAMGHLQCESADTARRIGGSLRRKLGAERFGEMNQRFTGKTTYAWVRDDEAAA